MSRTARVERRTNETQIEIRLDLDPSSDPAPEALAGTGIDTGIPFFDHMLDQLSRHGRFELSVSATGDLEIDAHHTVEDVGIALGDALTEALGDKRGITRYGSALVPMEESLARVAVDISGRPLLAYRADVGAEMIGQFETGLTEEFLMALCRSAGLTVHVDLLHRGNAHHSVEAIFKALAVALGTAISIDARGIDQIPSTKGTL